jgi:hypothetical protein
VSERREDFVQTETEGTDMTTVIVAHGAEDPGAAKLKVPKGLTVDFYSEIEENLLIMHGLAVIARGDAGVDPLQRYTEDQEIPNYQYSPLTDEQLGQALQLDRSGLRMWFVGNEIPGAALCTDYVGCDNAGANIGEDVHHCDGVFGRAAKESEDHLVFIACRGKLGAPPKATMYMLEQGNVQDTGLLDDVKDIEADFFAKSLADQEKAWESWPENSKVWIREASLPMKGWSVRYNARELFNREGIEGFVGAFPSFSPADIQWIFGDPDLPNVVDAFKTKLFGMGVDDQDEYWKELPERVQDWARGIPDGSVKVWEVRFKAREAFRNGGSAALDDALKTMSQEDQDSIAADPGLQALKDAAGA